MNIGWEAREHVDENVVFLTQLTEERVREEIVAADPAADKTAMPIQQDKLLGLFNRESPQEGLIGEREDGRIDADAQGKRENHGGGRDGRMPKLAQSVADVSCEVIEGHPAARFVEPFTGAGGISKSAASGGERLLRRHAFVYQAVGFDLKVRLDLFVKLAITAALGEHLTQA
jgi:hypothetical protein